jgi:hypothetical protein
MPSRIATTEAAEILKKKEANYRKHGSMLWWQMSMGYTGEATVAMDGRCLLKYAGRR